MDGSFRARRQTAVLLPFNLHLPKPSLQMVKKRALSRKEEPSGSRDSQRKEAPRLMVQRS